MRHAEPASGEGRWNASGEVRRVGAAITCSDALYNNPYAMSYMPEQLTMQHMFCRDPRGFKHDEAGAIC